MSAAIPLAAGPGVNGIELGVVLFFFILVTIGGFLAARWRRAESLNSLDEWGLGGRGFGTWVTWFLLGGDLYTAYTFIAVPAAMYGAGAVSGYFAVPYTILVYPIIFVFMPRMWSVSRRRNYVTTADFVRGRFGSPTLALAVAFTGILATMPYIALQLVGIEAVLDTMGLGGASNTFVRDLPLIIAFAVLAAYTYSSGLRAPALIAFVKDFLVYIVIIVAVIYVGAKIGFGDVFDAAKAKAAAPKTKGTFLFIPPDATYWAYGSLALGSAMALFMYPHAMTASMAARSRNVIRRNASILPTYSLMLALLALLGFVAIHEKTSPIGADGKPNAQLIVPHLFQDIFPSWFAGVAFAAIAIGALVPAAIMSIAAANLFTRNVWVEYVQHNATPHQEARVAKIVSLVVKFGALIFVLTLDKQNAINFQLLGGVWIMQTFLAIVGGLYTRWFHRWALLLGWAVGMVYGTVMAYRQASVTTKHFGSPLAIFPFTDTKVYIAITAFALNVLVAVVVTLVLRVVRLPQGADETEPEDYYAEAPAAGTPPPPLSATEATSGAPRA